MRDYTNAYQTAYANLGNGAPATLFSSYDQQTVNTHFPWMQQNGCDTAALQRFNPNGGEGPTRDAMAAKVRAAAEAYGRKFYIMYDVTGWTNMQSEIKTDWTNKMSAHTASSAYARQNGKPVVCIWGFGFNDANHPLGRGHLPGRHQLVQGPGLLRDRRGAARVAHRHRRLAPGLPGDVYHAFNMISPWMVGAIGTAADSDNAYTTYHRPGPGRLRRQRHRLPALRPARRRVGAPARRTATSCGGSSTTWCAPGVAGHLHLDVRRVQRGQPDRQDRRHPGRACRPAPACCALDEDGTACSSDYYLRLTNDGGRMLKGQIALTATRPTQPIVGPSGSTGTVREPARPGQRHVS